MQLGEESSYSDMIFAISWEDEIGSIFEGTYKILTMETSYATCNIYMNRIDHKANLQFGYEKLC